jgi:cytochrome P450
MVELLRGNRIRAGDRVVNWNMSANRDGAAFGRPDCFGLTRSPNDHLAFGHGQHLCLGADLARPELRVILDEVLRRIPGHRIGRPDRAAALELRGRHQAHAGAIHAKSHDCR